MKKSVGMLLALAAVAIAAVANAAGFDVAGFLQSNPELALGLSGLGMMGSLKTQGTMLYFEDPDTNLPVKVGCPTNITGLSVPRDQIEVTCLDSDAREYVAGMGTPGTATFTINFDPQDASHIRMSELYNEGVTLQWAIGLSDGTAAPTGDAASYGFDYPTTRSWIAFEGFINDFPFDFALNSVVTSNLGIQVSGAARVIRKTTP